jgi:hypothetical protein
VGIPHRLTSRPAAAPFWRRRPWLTRPALGCWFASAMLMISSEACLAQKPDPFLSAAPPIPERPRSPPATAPVKPRSRAQAPLSSSEAEATRPPQMIDAELSTWQAIAQSANAIDFDSYLTRFPQGRFVEAARARLAALRPSQPAAPSPGSANAFSAVLLTPSQHTEVRKVITREIESHMTSSRSYAGGGRNGNDCVLIELPQLTLAVSPRHGTATFQQTEEKPQPCPNSIRVMGVFYKPHPGFVGEDQFTFMRKGNWGNLDRYVTIKITVQ